MNLNLSKEWYARAGASEEGHSVTAGISGADFPGPEAHRTRQASTPGVSNANRFARLINLQRRALQLSMEALAEQTSLDQAEIYEIENESNFLADPRTVSRLAETLKLPRENLLHFSKLSGAANRSVRETAARFATVSAPDGPLTPAEREELRDLVNALNEADGRV